MNESLEELRPVAEATKLLAQFYYIIKLGRARRRAMALAELVDE